MDSIENYFLIGDLHSAALVSKNASIDWLCLPHFDSPSIFGRLLDKNAGHFSIISHKKSKSAAYIKNTAIVEFEFEDKDSKFQIRDFMVPRPVKKCEEHFLVRKIVGVKGKSKVTFSFIPKEDYGLTEFEQDESILSELPSSPEDKDSEPALILKTGNHTIFLYIPKDAVIEYEKGEYRISLTIQEGQKKSLIMAYAEKISKSYLSHDDLRQETDKFWKEWVRKGKYFDYHKDQLIRSAITLKLMQFYPTGALIAAPTTSLPEELGSVRNWDYRYVWIRDATFTLYAFYVLGYTEEADHFFEFVRKVAEKESKEHFTVGLMYTIDGKEVPQEQVLGHLAGYKNSKPVRIGNEAAAQFQLDLYGILIDTHYFVSKKKIEVHDLHKRFILQMAEGIEKMWKIKDNGIWEVRSGVQHFTYSKVMAWVGINRALRMKKLLKLTEEQIKKFKKLEKEIYDWIWKNCYDPNTKSFQQYPGAPLQDSSNFLFVLLQFLDKDDKRTKTILDKTFKELSAGDSFVYRYLGPDGLPRGEGAFLLCTFWMISSYAICEDTEKAEKMFDSFQKHMKSHWLLSEEIESKTGEYLGNYPQAFSHMGFIMAAYYLHRYKKRK